jgi:hypothetical protein
MGVITDDEDEGLLMEASALDSFLDFDDSEGLELSNKGTSSHVLMLSLSSSEDVLDFVMRLRTGSALDDVTDPSSRSVEPLLLLIVVVLELYCTFDYPSLITLHGGCL